MWGLRLCSFLLIGTGAVWFGTGGPSPAAAQDLQQIQAEMEAMRAEITALRKQVQDAQAQATAATSAAASSGKSDLDLKVKWKGAPELSSEDGKFKMKVRGRVEVDYNKANQDSRLGCFAAGREIRRARPERHCIQCSWWLPQHSAFSRERG